MEFWPYTGAVWSRAFKNGKPRAIGVLIGLIIAVAILGLQIGYGVIPKQGSDIRWFILLLPYALCLVAFMAWHLWFAAWQLHTEEVALANSKENQIRIELRSAQKALEDERERNSKPEVSIKLIGRTFHWADVKVTGFHGSDPTQQVTTAKVCITVLLKFVNLTPRPTTIDKCFLQIKMHGTVVETDLLSDRRPSGFIQAIPTPQDIAKLEANVFLAHGIGVTRYAQFLTELAVDEDVESNGVLKVSAVDSFGTSWECERTPISWK